MERTLQNQKFNAQLESQLGLLRQTASLCVVCDIRSLYSLHLCKSPIQKLLLIYLAPINASNNTNS